MDILVVLCHPDRDSFNHAVASRVVNALESVSHNPLFHDLYKEDFDPVLTEEELKRGFSFDESVQLYSEELQSSSGLILIHPDWWGQPPGLLKGWVDRVFRPGTVYEYEGPDFSEKKPVPLLTGKKAVVFCTTNKQDPGSGDIIETAWEEGVFSFCGVENSECHILYNLYNSSYDQRKSWLRSVENVILSVFPQI